MTTHQTASTFRSAWNVCCQNFKLQTKHTTLYLADSQRETSKALTHNRIHNSCIQMTSCIRDSTRTYPSTHPVSGHCALAATHKHSQIHLALGGTPSCVNTYTRTAPCCNKHAARTPRQP